MPQNKENNMITQWFPSKSYNVQNSNKNKQQQNDNVSPSSSQQNIKSTNLPTNQKKKKNELTLKSFLECGAWVLGSWRSPSSSFHSRDGCYFFPLKVRKDGPLEDAIENAKNGGLEIGFKKMGLLQRWSRTQRSEEILREMNEIKFRSLGKWFSMEEMVRWWRKCKWKKLVNSNNGGRRESEEGEVKKKMMETSTKGHQKFGLPFF